ncbi:MAG TPA: hypothetical protein VM940_08205 [Chthoniobacterales bacterium]|jgi:hypothetical protein|nr:hypothetical protein [Chthoniobacterales bacterium]
MGVHKVIARLSSERRVSGIIINSSVFLDNEEAGARSEENWQYLIKEAAKSAIVVTGVEVVPREPETLRGIRQIALANEKNAQLAERTLLAANSSFGIRREQLLEESRRYEFSAKSEAAADAPITLTSSGEVFKRFSMRPDDHRVTPGKGLVAGTFATTESDAAAHIKTGMDAVARYALPNAAPASNVFTIAPPKDIDLRRGTTQPANNQPGGGVEVIFVNGSPDGTVTGPVKIPDR